MMASDILYIVFVVLCAVHSVHSSGIWGNIEHSNRITTEMKVSNYIEGVNWANVEALTLDRLVGEALPTLTIANFKSIDRIKLTKISLQHLPVFVNTSCREISMTGNKIKSVPAKAFSGLRPLFIILSNNEINSIADQSFNTGAEWVNLECNKITKFSQSWFEDPGKIDLLYLSDNRIVHIQDRAFNQMTGLRELRLIHNRITSIGTEAFSSNIIFLSLGFNNIAQLSADMMADRDEPLVGLYLHHNQLNYLPKALLLKWKPREISLFGNPWQCQCSRDIESWLRELNTTRRDMPARRGQPVCVVPVNFQNFCVPTADTELQQTYARGLSPVTECLSSGCKPCINEDFYLTNLT